jgi:CheY-like chemotaxis protein
LEKRFVLLVDDNEATSTLITALLQSEYVVEVVRDGAEAIEKLKQRQYAAVLLDLLMPIADGYAVLDFLQAERPDLLRRVLVVTAALGTREMQRLRPYDIFGVVAKPFEVDVLFQTVRQCAGDDHPPMRGPLLSSGMLLLLAAEVLRRV